MDFHINTKTIHYQKMQSNGLYFIPEKEKIKNIVAIYTHGHTSHKGSLISWGIKHLDYGIPCVLFDLPGHYLGSYNEVESLEEFSNKAPFLFEKHFEEIQTLLPELSFEHFIVGGHSLGALMALKASETPFFNERPTLVMGVGFGSSPLHKKENHMLETPFFQRTLKVYQQFVSPALRSPEVFSWLKEEKKNLKTKNKDVYLLTGRDDLIANEEQVRHLAQQLEKNGCRVTTQIAENLPHHTPDRASVHLMSHLKKVLSF